MELISEQRLALVIPELSVKVCAAAAALEPKRIFFRVAQGLRTAAEQEEDWQKGRDKEGNVIPRGMPGHGIVTRARPMYSAHNFGYAVDCYPFVHGDSGLIDLSDPKAPEFVAMVQALKAQGLVWGGDWKSICDEPHFQIANAPVTPTDLDRTLFAQGGFPAVWAQYKESPPELMA